MEFGFSCLKKLDESYNSFNGIFWKLHTGSQWRDVPERYGPWTTIY